ncbi:MAG: SH3 domain-containing protein [Candidatus Acidiferrum sp.]
MTRKIPRLYPVLALAVFLPSAGYAQATSSQRIFQKSKSEVEKALQQLHSSLGGRLPVLDGFVDTTQSLDGYSQGYYQCSVQLTPAGSGGTLVRVTAKITAWYAGAGSAQAGYRVLPSNGRLEGDLLDRMQAALGVSASTGNMPTPSAPPNEVEAPRPVSSPSPQSDTENPSLPAAPLPSDANPPSSGAPAPLRGVPGDSVSGGASAPPSNAANAVPAALANEDLATLRARREKAELRLKDLSTAVQNLEEIQSEQTHPLDLAVVKRPGTAVLSKPGSSGVLFRADVGDEFQVIEKEENWVHVQISGVSRGWIRRSELDLPDLAEPPRPSAGLNQTEGPAFRVSREETKSFPGNWEPLRGKTVRIVWVEPASSSPTSTADAKRSFAKSLFRKAYLEIASANPPDAGVVIVFDSADGGQISATLATLKEWQAGNLPETSFWKQCSVDPPELLQEPSKAVGGGF